MKLEKSSSLISVEQNIKILEIPDTIILDNDGKILDPSIIKNYVIVRDRLGVPYKEKKPRTTRKRKSKADAENKSEDDFLIDKNDKEISREDLLTLIADHRKINETSIEVLNKDGWYICPIYKDIDNLYPLVPKEVKNGYEMNLSKSIAVLPNNWQKGKDWEYNSMSILNAILDCGTTSRYIAVGTIRINTRTEFMSTLKCVTTSYILNQKNRIKMGNFILSTFLISMGKKKFNDMKEELNPNKNKSCVDKVNENGEIIKTNNIQTVKLLENSFKEIMGNYKNYAENNNLKVNEIIPLNKFSLFKNETIKNYSLYKQIAVYFMLKNAENICKKEMARLVHMHPLWYKYLVGVSGVGEVTAAIMLSSLDIRKTEHPSGFIRYLGMDTVPDLDENGNIQYNSDGSIKKRARCKKDKVTQTYLASDGSVKTRENINYNIFVKSRIIGVLGQSFVKHKGPYNTIYKDYKERITNSSRYDYLFEGKDKRISAHANNMAIKYACSQFIIDTWLRWREIEGLPLNGGSYAEGKLGLNHRNGYERPLLVDKEQWVIPKDDSFIEENEDISYDDGEN